jgi:hypothetical protein
MMRSPEMFAVRAMSRLRQSPEGRERPATNAGENRWVGFTTAELEELSRWADDAWFTGPHDPNLLDDLRAGLDRRTRTP